MNYPETEDPRAIELFTKKIYVVNLMKMASALAFSKWVSRPGVMERVPGAFAETCCPCDSTNKTAERKDQIICRFYFGFLRFCRFP